MATLAFINPKLVNHAVYGSEPEQRGGLMENYIKEAASQTYVVNDLVYLVDGAGTLAICTVASTRLDSKIAGLAKRAATGVTSTAAEVHAIRADDEFLMNVYHSTAALAITALTQFGVQYGIIKPSASGKWHVDIENTTDIEDATHSLARVEVVGFETQYGIDSTGQAISPAIGDTYGLVRVKFLKRSAASDGSPAINILQLG